MEFPLRKAAASESIGNLVLGNAHSARAHPPPRILRETLPRADLRRPTPPRLPQEHTKLYCSTKFTKRCGFFSFFFSTRERRNRADGARRDARIGSPSSLPERSSNRRKTRIHLSRARERRGEWGGKINHQGVEVSRCSDLVPAPAEVMHWGHWELSEMEGTLCVTCMDAQVDAVVVIRLDFGRRAAYGTVPWTLAGHFEGGCLRGRKDVKLLRSQGKAEVVMWDPSSETVVAMDVEGRTTRTIKFVPGSAYYADFIPYVRSLAAVSGSGKRANAERSAMAFDAEAC